MMERMKKSWGFIAIAAVVLAVCYCHSSAIKKDSFLREQDFIGCKLYIRGASCPAGSAAVMVEDGELLDEIVRLCLGAEPVRPSISVDMKAGGTHLSFSLENEGAVYSFSFFDVEEQLDIGYAHREQPIIGISKAVITESNSRESEWGWRCKLPPSDYASLYNLLQPYVDGEMVG